MSDLESVLDAARAARERGALDEALDDYKKALMLTSEGDVLERSEIYAAIAETKRAQGKLREAELNYEKALAAMPGYTPALVALVELADEEGDHKRSIERRRRLVERLVDDASKARELLRIGQLLEEKGKDPRGASEALERARELGAPADEVLPRLRRIYEALHRWNKVADIEGALADAATGPARAMHRFAQADVLLGRLRDEEHGAEILERVLDDDPSHDKALAALVAVRTRQDRLADLARTYAKLVDKHAARGDVEGAHDACRRLALLRRDKLADGPGAIDAFLGALRCKPRDVDSRAALAELYVAKGEPAAAAEELAQCAADQPLRAQTYRRLFEIFQKNGMPDRAYLAALALDELGASEIDHQLVIEQHREGGRPSATLTDDDWDAWLRAPGADPIVSRILRSVCKVATLARVAELKTQKKLVTLDPAARQDPQSTATIVRTFSWASQVLGAPLPALYVLGDVPGGIAAVQVAEPSTALGPAVLSGLPLPELSFVVARHLTYYRPEHYVLVFYPSLAELTTLFLASLKVVRKDMPVPESKALASLRKTLADELDLEDKDALEAAVEDFEAQGGRADLLAWIRSVERTANRAGLLLCADLPTAVRHIRGEERGIAELTAEDRRGDLLAFLVSRGLASAREKLKLVSKAGSLRPPPPAGG
jgi:tetratricopeptide (TPR) repeat protein